MQKMPIRECVPARFAAVCIVCLSLLTSVVTSPARADSELPGVLLNQTRTVAGQAFYDGFFSYWQARDMDGIYSLVITEKPFPQSVGSSLMTVTFEDVVVLRQVIRFNVTKAHRAGEDATEFVYGRVVQAVADREFRNPDMAQSGY